MSTNKKNNNSSISRKIINTPVSTSKSKYKTNPDSSSDSKYILHLAYKHVSKHRINPTYLERIKRTSSVLIPYALSPQFIRFVFTKLGIPNPISMVSNRIFGEKKVVLPDLTNIDSSEQYMDTIVKKNPTLSSQVVENLNNFFQQTFSYISGSIPFKVAMRLYILYGYIEFAQLGYTTVRSWMDKDILHLKVDQEKMRSLLDTTVTSLGGKIIEHQQGSDENFAMYEFSYKRNKNTSISEAYVNKIDQRLKKIMLHLPTNVYIKYISKYNESPSNINASINSNSKIMVRSILYPRTLTTSEKDNIISNHDLENSDQSIIKYAEIMQKRYELFNEPQKSNWKDYIPYKMIKRNIGIPKNYATPEFSPLKKEYYDFEIGIKPDEKALKYNQPLSQFIKSTKELKQIKMTDAQWNIRLIVKDNFKEIFSTFMTLMPQHMRVIKVTTEVWNSLQNVSEIHQVFPKQKTNTKSIQKNRPMEDTIIHQVLYKRM